VSISSVEYAITRLQIENKEIKVMLQEGEELHALTERLEKADKERER